VPAHFQIRFKNCESQLRLTGAFTAEPESETLMEHQPHASCRRGEATGAVVGYLERLNGWRAVAIRTPD
jgi:hypothetical protein